MDRSVLRDYFLVKLTQK